MKDKLKIKLQNIEHEPWVYQFLNSKGKIIYIWKSVNLYSRVNSYFNGTSRLNFAKQKMVLEIDDINTILTNTWVESLLLETNLIKKYKPKYNILMKDDKNHLYIKITDEIFPRVIKTRIKNNKWIYYGPYTSTQAVDDILKVLKRIYGYRTSKTTFEKIDGKIEIKNLYGARIPSLEYYLWTSREPWLLKEENMHKYDESIENIKKFLWWDFAGVLEELEKKMLESAKRLEFEQAQKYKNEIGSIKSLDSAQIVRDIIWYDADVINYVSKYWKLYLSKIEVRSEKITGIYNFELEDKLEDIDESVEFFIENNYLENEKKLVIILPKKINIDSEILEHLKLKIEIPKIWQKVDILTLRYKNAFQFGYKKHLASLSVKWFTKKDALSTLKVFWYKDINKDLIFECYDISHLWWSHTVASRTVMINGKPDNSKYKKYKLKTLKQDEINDFDSMREIITRRIKELKQKNNLPDMMVIDGWKGQLSSVMEIVDKYKKDPEHREIIEKLQIISLAERAWEVVFVPYSNKWIKLDKDSNELKLLQKLRDESHRFAITFNRDSRIKAQTKNILEQIPGIWPISRKKLLNHYWSIDSIKDDDELKKLINKNQIESLRDHGII